MSGFERNKIRKQQFSPLWGSQFFRDGYKTTQREQKLRTKYILGQCKKGRQLSAPYIHYTHTGHFQPRQGRLCLWCHTSGHCALYDYSHRFVLRIWGSGSERCARCTGQRHPPRSRPCGQPVRHPRCCMVGMADERAVRIRNALHPFLRFFAIAQAYGCRQTYICRETADILRCDDLLDEPCSCIHLQTFRSRRFSSLGRYARSGMDTVSRTQYRKGRTDHSSARPCCHHSGSGTQRMYGFLPPFAGAKLDLYSQTAEEREEKQS